MYKQTYMLAVSDTAKMFVLRSYVVLLMVPTLVPTGYLVMVPPPKDRASNSAIAEAKSCWFEPVYDDLPLRLKEKLQVSGVKLLRYNVTFVNYTYNVMTEAGGDLFRPHLWIRTVNREGTNLLMFDDNFEVFSMGLLGVGIVDMDVELIDSPRRCIHNLTASERITTMRYLLEADFRLNTTDPDEMVDGLNEQICNMRVYVPADEVNTGSAGALFTYTCCFNDHDVLKCADIVENSWVSTLIQILKAIIVFLILYSPKFVPSVYYKERDEGRIKFQTTLPEDCRLRIEKDEHEYHILKQDDMVPINTMTKAKETLDSFDNETSAIYTCQVSDITISVPRDKLLKEDSIPVSISTMLYDNIFHCRLGNIPPFTSCCTSSMYGDVFEERFEKYKIRWKECLQVLVKILVFCLCLVPSIVQYVVYNDYIASGIKGKENALGRVNAAFVYKTDLDILGLGDITLHFYSVVIVIITGIILEIYYHFIKRFLEFPKFSTHFQDMDKQGFLPVFKSALHLTLVPFLKCGVFGILVFPVYTIVIFVYLVYVSIIIFPILNLISRLFLYPFLPYLVGHRRRFLRYFGISDYCEDNDVITVDTRSYTKKFLAAWYPYMAICLIFITYLLIWMVDCVIFYTKVLFYTGIGIIANSDKTLPYVTVLILVGIYISQIFGGISTTYSDYSKTIRNLILSRYTEYSEMRKQSSKCGLGKAFFFMDTPVRMFGDLGAKISCEGAAEPVCFQTLHLFVFLERIEEKESTVPSRDPYYESFDSEIKESFRVYTPKKLFFETLDLDAIGSPGPVWKNVMWACVRLLIVMAFLGFVVIVVMGLGDTYKISITNQLFLTVAGGLLPLIFRHVVTDVTPTTPVIDAENTDLTLNLTHQLENYTEDWELVDLTLSVVKVEKCNVDDVTRRVKVKASRRDEETEIAVNQHGEGRDSLVVREEGSINASSPENNL